MLGIIQKLPSKQWNQYYSNCRYQVHNSGGECIVEKVLRIMFLVVHK